MVLLQVSNVSVVVSQKLLLRLVCVSVLLFCVSWVVVFFVFYISNMKMNCVRMSVKMLFFLVGIKQVVSQV